MTDTALLLVDVQRSFEVRPYWSEKDLPAFRDRLLALIEGCKARKVPIVRILHVEDEGAFSLASGLVKPMAWLPEHHDVLFHKHVHNAFTDTGLDYWLRTRGIKKVIVTGIRTEQCCETTTRVASDLGYAVDYVTEATLTFPMTHPNGRTYSPEELKERTELVLEGRFASIKTVTQCLAGL
ncbi:isochorismatase family protein [Aggregicoccus sp. 17bor-14]|uniref:cysteine hydrolase family protein n=1 Tax=Myxococcaceae TaxID=31 RepID=UPI00129C4F59|nr:MULTISPECIES: isochorismatase family protein [Myxococcaceae]MBF5044800.1 isochorismatase family protein [Simulacricoccus sp. 17bor-14]MRI90544.1 isochorismatase family protein [Aggregicoccus sp. 17bor-14]